MCFLGVLTLYALIVSIAVETGAGERRCRVGGAYNGLGLWNSVFAS